MMNNARNNPSQQRPNMGRPGPRGVMFREKPKNKKKMIKRLIGYLGSYWKSLIALLLVMLKVVQRRFLKQVILLLQACAFQERLRRYLTLLY